MAQKNEMSFEEAVKKLDSIVRQLEKGDAPLSDSLQLFEEGTALIRLCGKQLDQAEQKVAKLKKGPEGEPVQVSFEEEN